MKTRRELEEEAPHARPEQVGDVIEILDQHSGSAETFHMGDQLADLDGVNESLSTRLPLPSFHVCDRRPGIERGVELDGVEVTGVVPEPILRRKIRRIEAIAPMPVEPTGTSDVIFPRRGKRWGGIRDDLAR